MHGHRDRFARIHPFLARDIPVRWPAAACFRTESAPRFQMRGIQWQTDFQQLPMSPASSPSWEYPRGPGRHRRSRPACKLICQGMARPAPGQKPGPVQNRHLRAFRLKILSLPVYWIGPRAAVVPHQFQRICVLRLAENVPMRRISNTAATCAPVFLLICKLKSRRAEYHSVARILQVDPVRSARLDRRKINRMSKSRHVPRHKHQVLYIQSLRRELLPCLSSTE